MTPLTPQKARALQALILATGAEFSKVAKENDTMIVVRTVSYKSHMLSASVDGEIITTRFNDEDTGEKFYFNRPAWSMADALAWGKRWVDRVVTGAIAKTRKGDEMTRKIIGIVCLGAMIAICIITSSEIIPANGWMFLALGGFGAAALTCFI
jgi:hypothetical protein